MNRSNCTLNIIPFSHVMCRCLVIEKFNKTIRKEVTNHGNQREHSWQSLTCLRLAGFSGFSSIDGFRPLRHAGRPSGHDGETGPEKGDVTPVLKWVQKDHEAELKEVFKRTLAVRNKGKDAQELADMYFFETLVRLHRAGEGAPYDGLKPAGELEPSVAAADKALETGSVEKLTKETAHLVTEGIHQRFEKTMKAKKMADKSVEQGREYVEAYVDCVHYVERSHMAAAGPDAHHGERKVCHLSMPTRGIEKLLRGGHIMVFSIHEKRIQDCTRLMWEENLDVLLLTKPSNIFYLTGDGRLCSFAMITRDGKAALGVPKTDIEDVTKRSDLII